VFVGCACPCFCLANGGLLFNHHRKALLVWQPF
jgi:hypothetical protein